VQGQMYWFMCNSLKMLNIQKLVTEIAHSLQKNVNIN